MSENGLPVAEATKVCPRCGARLFADMDVCYGCLYDFSRHEMGREGGEDTGAVGCADPCVGPRSPSLGDPATCDDDELWGSLDELWDDETKAPLACAGAQGTASRAISLPLMAESDDEVIRLAPIGDEQVPHLRFHALGLSFSCGVPTEGLVVGRDPSCDVAICSNTLSRQHLRIARVGSQVMAQDLGATNPALVNGRVLDEAVLGKEDVLELRGAGVTICACS